MQIHIKQLLVGLNVPVHRGFCGPTTMALDHFDDLAVGIGLPTLIGPRTMQFQAALTRPGNLIQT